MSDEGASPRELLLEASRRNNTALLSELLASQASPAQISHLLNTATDGVGEYCLHVAAMYGSYDVLDLLLDQEGLEVDPVDRLEADTPLHKAVRFVNGLPRPDWESGSAVVELLLDAGADPRIRNKAKLKAVELVDSRNAALRGVLQRAEFAIMAGNDVVVEDDDDDFDHDRKTRAGSASDSE